MTLATDEFIRRFLLHVLPRGFHRIRHYGLLATAWPRSRCPGPWGYLRPLHGDGQNCTDCMRNQAPIAGKSHPMSLQSGR
jgi:hypothetical protein